MLIGKGRTIMGFFVIGLGIAGIWIVGKSVWLSGQYRNSYQLVMPILLILLGIAALRKQKTG